MLFCLLTFLGGCRKTKKARSRFGRAVKKVGQHQPYSLFLVCSLCIHVLALISVFIEAILLGGSIRLLGIISLIGISLLFKEGSATLLPA